MATLIDLWDKYLIGQTASPPGLSVADMESKFWNLKAGTSNQNANDARRQFLRTLGLGAPNDTTDYLEKLWWTSQVTSPPASASFLDIKLMALTSKMMYLNLNAGTVSTPDTPNQAIAGPVRLTVVAQLDTLTGVTFPTLLNKTDAGFPVGPGGYANREYIIYCYGGNQTWNLGVSNANGDNLGVGGLVAPLLGNIHTFGFDIIPGSSNVNVNVDGATNVLGIGGVTSPQNTAGAVVIGPGAGQGLTGKLYSAKMETISGAGGTVTGLVWKFDVSEVTGTTYTDPRGNVWTLSGAGIITGP